MYKIRALVIVTVVVGLVVVSVGSGVAASSASADECTNTINGNSFEVPDGAVDRVGGNSGVIECTDSDNGRENPGGGGS